MKVTAICLVALFAAGCAVESNVTSTPSTTPQVDVTVEAEPLHVSPAIEKLRVLAAQKNLHWRIYCMHHYDDQVQQFAAWAAPSDVTLGQYYIEEGGKPHWYNDSFPSADEAAVWLAKALTGEPNVIPRHKPEEKQRNPVQCGEIAGDEKGRISY